jgi:hypothetical protein
MKHSKRFFSSPLKIILSLIVAGVLIVTVLEITNTTYIFHKKPLKTNFPTTPTKGGGSSFNQKGQTPSSNNNSTNNTQTSPSPNNNNPVNTSPAGNTSSSYLISPWGNFVSNHNPGQNGTPTTETSVCNTTQGASCYISFSNGSVVESLPSQVTDASGATFWNNWSISNLGLTSGSWKITATATLKGQTKTSSDSMELVVP